MPLAFAIPTLATHSAASKEIKRLARDLLYDRALQNLVVHRQLTPATYLDGIVRRIPESLHREFFMWSEHPELRIEASTAYQYYRGGNVLDIGAFHGFYSHLLAPKALPGARFLSFEPDERVYSELLFNLSVASTHFPKIRFNSFKEIIGSGEWVGLHYPLGETGHPCFGRNGKDFRSLTIDTLLATFQAVPELIKIDVEGAEWGVLQGMKKTLHHFDGSLFLELHHMIIGNEEKKKIEDYLTEFNLQKKILCQDDQTERQVWRPLEN